MKTNVARLLANSLPAWSCVNLGIGVPTLAMEFVRDRNDVRIHAENGALGTRVLVPGEEWDGSTVDPSKHPMALSTGASCFDSLDSFRLVHSGRLDLSVMGAYQVSSTGDLANWRRPGSETGGIGGAADMLTGARSVWVACLHQDKAGSPRLVRECSTARTGVGVVDVVFTELGVFRPRGGRFVAVALAAGVSRTQARERTGAPVEFAAAVQVIDYADPAAVWRDR